MPLLPPIFFPHHCPSPNACRKDKFYQEDLQWIRCGSKKGIACHVQEEFYLLHGVSEREERKLMNLPYKRFDMAKDAISCPV
jgi:hypothetical protein